MVGSKSRNKKDKYDKYGEEVISLSNLEIKIIDEKKIYGSSLQQKPILEEFMLLKKGDDMLPVESSLAQLEDENKALDRLTKSKEAPLIEDERTVQVALEKTSMLEGFCGG
ncbi:hypothetical protein QVD17_19682 [Tagetes erecta]|uniref:Uncharacterized protein n=1 Tax=Tagetes erecta TaxID=13708 RepID=A0AAD8NWN9_TARER|nr:hypothetical protein QVD17_19682 [Tagetes erecta]